MVNVSGRHRSSIPRFYLLKTSVVKKRIKERVRRTKTQTKNKDYKCGIRIEGRLDDKRNNIRRKKRKLKLKKIYRYWENR